MLIKGIRASAVGAAITIAGALTGLNAAHAAVYNGSWDPAYGGMFGSLGWKATASFDVPTACLSQADGSYAAPLSTAACAGFSVLSAELSFYNVAAPTTILESFTLDTGVFINGIDIAGGELVGINTGFFSAAVPEGGSLGIAGNGVYGFSLILFNGTFAQLVYAKPVTASPLCPGPNSDACGYSQNPAIGTITAAVPEPQTYALMLAGLGALGWVARRRAGAARRD